MVAALATAQTIKVANTEYTPDSMNYGDGGLLQGPSHAQGGIRLNNREVGEGGEFVVNRKATAANLTMLYEMNNINKPVTSNASIDYDLLANKLGQVINDKQVILTQNDLVENENEREIVKISTSF